MTFASMPPAAMGSPPTKGETGTCYKQARPPIKNSTLSFCYPSPSSVKGRVLADLLAGEKITHKTVWLRHGSSRASHHIMMLRHAGFPVITEEIDVPTSDGRIARIGLYSLPAEAIEAAGECGQQFIAEVLAAKRGD